MASNQVVVGVTSYGRSYGMADGNCYGENCLYTGSALVSTATKGRCTDTGGYISDAEIKEIIASGTVNQNFVDAKSNSNILVYNGNQWVGWMSPQIKASRKATYQNLNMGGSTDWASDLEDYQPNPPTAGSWGNFILAVKAGSDPYVEGPRTGNWTSLHCDDPAVVNLRGLTARQRWNGVDAPDAWKDVIQTWNTIDKPAGMHFTQSVSNNIHGPESAECGTLLSTNNCGQTLQCDGFIGSGSGPAAFMIWNSMVVIHELYDSMHAGIVGAAALSINNALQSFEDKFAPVPKPPDDTWLQILLDVLGLGMAMGSGAFITKCKFLSSFLFFFFLS